MSPAFHARIPSLARPVAFCLAALLVVSCVFVARAAPEGLTPAQENSLRKFVADYASWDYSGEPEDFRNRLDYGSYEEQRRILLQLAALDWNGFWGKYWRNRGVNDLAILNRLRPRAFWLCFHGALDSRGNPHAGHPRPIKVDIHTISMARGVAYVTYQASYGKGDHPSDQKFTVLRSRWVNGQWKLLPFPSITAKYRHQLEKLQAKREAATHLRR